VTPAPTRAQSDRGQAAGFEMWAIGILVFVCGTLLVAQAWATVNARQSAGQIAQQYLRAYSESSTRAEALDAGDRAAHAVADSRHVSTFRVTPPSAFGRCQFVVVTADVTVPAVRIPYLGSWGAQSVTATRRELTDPYRPIDAAEETTDAPTVCD